MKTFFRKVRIYLKLWELDHQEAAAERKLADSEITYSECGERLHEIETKRADVKRELEAL